MSKDILYAFFSLRMWHIRSVYNPNGSPYYTADNEEEMFVLLRSKGFELLCCNNRNYYFKKL